MRNVLTVILRGVPCGHFNAHARPACFSPLGRLLKSLRRTYTRCTDQLGVHRPQLVDQIGTTPR
eukprot:3797219-Pleurochrysis_carterae.AAC.2